MKVLLLSRYEILPPPSRYRFYQFLPFLRANGLEFELCPLLDDDYIRHQYKTRSWALSPLPRLFVRRIHAMRMARRYDLVWLEKEALPWVPFWAECISGLLDAPYVVDFDDAMHHRYDVHSSWFVRSFLGGKIPKIMQRAALVIAGNDYIAEHALRSGARRVEVVPSVVDMNKYPVRAPVRNDHFTIGWIGAPANSRHLTLIYEALSQLCREKPARLRIIGGWKVDMPSHVEVEYVPWSEETEVAELQACDVGIMPLYDGPWERGKCGLKLINYMASGLPVIASPVGINSKIVQHDRNGFLADGSESWLTALRSLRDDEELRLRMGGEGRARAEKEYSLQVTAPKVLELLRSARS